MSLLMKLKYWAANLAALSGLSISAFELPGGFFMHDSYSSLLGGQLMTGLAEWNDAMPDRASVPPATAMIRTGSMLKL